jgi:glycosyltransferase involved in cell wall biosynthesis
LYREVDAEPPPGMSAGTSAPDGARRPRPRLVHVTTSDMSLVLLLGHQLRAFADAGYEVIGASAAGPYAAVLAEWGIEHVPLRHATRAMAPARDLRAAAELFRLFDRLRPEIVHTHNPKPGFYGRLAARAARVPAIVNTVHGLYATPDDRAAKRAVVYGLEAVAGRCSGAELVQNPEDVDVLARLGIPRGRLHLLGNGVDLARFDRSSLDVARVAAIRDELGARPTDVVCGLVGRLVREKGYPEVFAAVPQVRRDAPSTVFVVVGPHDPEKPDALTAAELCRAEAAGVRFLGPRDDVVDLYGAMDVYVLASHREGYPRSAMEASAMGVPVVATNIRGCRQVVDDGVTGLLVPLGDVTALVTAIVRFARSVELRTRMGTAARRRAERLFDEQRVIETTLGVYERLLRDRREREGAPSP